MKTWWYRLKYLAMQRRLDVDLAEEIESHRAMLEERLTRSGVPAADAGAASRRVLGNVALAREQAREILDRPVDRERAAGRQVRHCARWLAIRDSASPSSW